MTDPVMYNRRLRSDEIETWIEVCCPDSQKRSLFTEYAVEFMQLEDSMYFISSVEGKNIGGTAVYRDRVRLAMALVFLSLEKTFRKGVVAHLIKSSLPFFKSMAIRNVDAIVNPSDDTTNLPFPISTELACWTAKSLETLNFEKTDILYKATLEDIIIPENNEYSPWDKKPNIDGSRKLMWDLRKETGLNFSQVWLLRDIMLKSNSFHTRTIEDVVVASAGLLRIAETGIISPLFISKDVSIDDSLRIIVNKLGNVNSIELPIVGKEQMQMIDMMEEMLQTKAEIQELDLYRKNL
ncbi:MAG: hypothetical protein GF411_16175 [Candidatus Lokiarchaeota archaeon]|nr:hypothetical protein [Candidatus Lokiarchaeota archaeon]